jgi:putative MATE family efflux protein
MTAVKDLTRGPIGKQLFYLSLPIISTSFIQMAYSLTDMAWVGRLGTKSVAAVGAVGILVWLTNSVSLLNKVGAEISVAQAIGAQNLNKARCYASHNISMSMIVSLIWASLLFAFAYPILGIYKMEAAIEMEAVRYLRIVLCAFPFLFLSATFTGIYNAAGLSKIPFYINSSGLILNLVLDPVFIFALDMGTAGAALATVISQVWSVSCFSFN